MTTAQAAPESPRLADLIGYTDASLEHRVSVWTLRRAVGKGEIRTYPLPGNRTGLDRHDVAAWARSRAEGTA